MIEEEMKEPKRDFIETRSEVEEAGEAERETQNRRRRSSNERNREESCLFACE